MPVIYDTPTKTARMTATRDQIDAGSGPGILDIGTTAMGAVLASFVLNDPCGTVSGPTLTLSGFPKTASAGLAGTAAAAQIRDSNGVVRASGLTVGLPGSGADVILDAVVFTLNQSIQLQSAAITHAA